LDAKAQLNNVPKPAKTITETHRLFSEIPKPYEPSGSAKEATVEVEGISNRAA
jgi:hypothetical protein